MPKFSFRLWHTNHLSGLIEIHHISFILLSVLREVHSLFQTEFSTQGKLVLPLPVYTILSLVHDRALILPYEINTDKCTHTLLNCHFINTMRTSNMFQPFKGHYQGV